MFLGYSSQHKGYKCLGVSSGCVYISRDVVFDETVFPFKELHPNAGALLRSEILLLDPTLTPGWHAIDHIINHPDNSLAADGGDFMQGNATDQVGVAYPSAPVQEDLPRDLGQALVSPVAAEPDQVLGESMSNQVPAEALLD